METISANMKLTHIFLMVLITIPLFMFSISITLITTYLLLSGEYNKDEFSWVVLLLLVSLPLIYLFWRSLKWSIIEVSKPIKHKK